MELKPRGAAQQGPSRTPGPGHPHLETPPLPQPLLQSPFRLSLQCSSRDPDFELPACSPLTASSPCAEGPSPH